MLRARLRGLSGWSDACILNVSSRGLMINAPAASAAQGSTIELWHGEHLIVGTIVWRRGTRAGLQSEERIPVDAILAMGQSSSLQLTAPSWPEVERRKTPRTHDHSRLRGRALEFAGVAIVAVSLASGMVVLVTQALATPLHHVRAALGG
jgi:hypothetical protein